MELAAAKNAQISHYTGNSIRVTHNEIKYVIYTLNFSLLKRLAIIVGKSKPVLHAAMYVSWENID